MFLYTELIATGVTFPPSSFPITLWGTVSVEAKSPMPSLYTTCFQRSHAQIFTILFTYLFCQCTTVLLTDVLHLL